MLEKFLSNDFLKQNKTKLIKIVCLTAAIIAAFVIYTGGGGTDEEIVADTAGETVEEQETVTEEPEEVTVDIAGAVNESRVVTLPYGSRVADAIDECGGVTKDADLSTINRAALLTDGEKIYIPTEEETAEGITYKADQETLTASSGSDNGLVNINTATEDELQMLNGIGPVTAQKIVTYRESYGAFKSIEDLKEVNGIGEKTFADIKDDITV